MKGGIFIGRPVVGHLGKYKSRSFRYESNGIL